MKRYFGLALVLASVMACATFDVTAEKLTHQAIVQSEALHASQAITDAQFQATNRELNTVAVAGREFTKIVIAHKTKPSDVATFLAVIQHAIADLKAAPYHGAIQ